MKKIAMISALLVLTVALLTGCGCTRRGAEMDTAPATEMTILPTNIPETTAPTMRPTQPATELPTEPATDATMESGIMGTEDGATAETGARNRMR